jgi:hypothetical protein
VAPLRDGREYRRVPRSSWGQWPAPLSSSFTNGQGRAPREYLWEGRVPLRGCRTRVTAFGAPTSANAQRRFLKPSRRAAWGHGRAGL